MTFCCNRSGGSSPELLERVEAKYLALKRAYEEIKLRVDKQERITFLTLPECVCYAKEFCGTTVQDRYQAMYDLYHEVVEKGCRLLSTEPLFIIDKRTDFLEGKFTDQECNFTSCIPLEPACAPEEAVTIPSCRAFTCLCYGNYTGREIPGSNYVSRLAVPWWNRQGRLAAILLRIYFALPLIL